MVSMLLTILSLIFGFVLLISGANFLVNGASAVAKKFAISELVIGLTVVAFGTSMPELVVNVIASFNGSGQLAIGNILGSNISNILLVLGATSIIYPLAVKKTTVLGEIPFSLFIVVLLFLLLNDSFFGLGASFLSFKDGAILLLLFTIFVYYTITISLPNKKYTHHLLKRFLQLNGNDETPFDSSDDLVKDLSTFRSTFYILLGLGGLIFGGKLVVDSAVYFAEILGLSEFVIGVTVVALGTSLPELVTSVVAATKKKTDIAVGNIVGSNIFNILWILGVSALIGPIPFNSNNSLDLAFTFVATLLLLISLMLSKKHILTKKWGIVFVLVYFLYIHLQFI